MFSWLYRKLFGARPTLEEVQVQQMQRLLEPLAGFDWYYQRNNQKLGPCSIVHLLQLLAAEQIQPNDLVWREGMAQWLPLASVLPKSFPLPGASQRPASPSIPRTPGVGDPNAPQWYYSKDNQTRQGPVSLAQLQVMARTGSLDSAVMVWRLGLPRWVLLGTLEGIVFWSERTSPDNPPAISKLYTPESPVGPSPGKLAEVVEWCYSANRKSWELTSLAYIQAVARVGRVPQDALVWRPGLPGWIPVTSVVGMPFAVERNTVPGWSGTVTVSSGSPVSPPSAAPAPPRPAVAPTAAPQAPPPTPAPAPRPGVLNLDAGDFLPIARSDLKEQAQKVERWGPWFGRRDLIPPAEDPRTKLIDRGLVSNGLLSPEQLAEIHTVGAEMERLRPSLVRIEDQAARSGADAVQADRERRARLKEQKKAEAERRKKERADAVARRKATDIIFLGRGVSRRLHDRTSNVDRLKALGLPVLATPAELADVLGLRVPRLRWLAFHAEVASRIHYVQFTVPKKSGGLRTLSAPHKTLALAQQWILHNIVSKLPADAAAHGFLAGKSIVSNAREHTGRAVVVNVDLEDFFPNITFPRVRSVFQRAGYSGAVATILALLCTECPRRTAQYDGKTYYVALGPRGLPQGACTSPGLSNQVARRLDRRLTGLASKLGLTYTRYADDLTCSGPLPLPLAREDEAAQEQRDGIGYLLARIRHIAEAESFRINEKKSRVLRQGTAQLVTGLVVNVKPSVRRQEIRRLRAILHRARHEGLESQNRERRPDFRAWLIGKIAFISMVRPEIGAKLKAALLEVK